MKIRALGFWAVMLVILPWVLAMATPARAALYHSLDDWNNATTTTDFTISSPSVPFLFFGACPASNSDPCSATGDTNGPLALASTTRAEAMFIKENTTPNWGITYVGGRQTNPLGSGGTSGTLTVPEASRLWILSFDNALIGLLFDDPVTSITFCCLSSSLNHLDVGTIDHLDVGTIAPAPVPIPPALPLFASALIGIVLLKRR